MSRRSKNKDMAKEMAGLLEESLFVVRNAMRIPEEYPAGNPNCRCAMVKIPGVERRAAKDLADLMEDKNEPRAK